MGFKKKKQKKAKRAGKSVKKSRSGSPGVGQSIKDTAIDAGKNYLGIGGKKGGGARKARNAKQLLKKAYETKARRQIRMGMLGQARRTLRKKATVV